MNIMHNDGVQLSLTCTKRRRL